MSQIIFDKKLIILLNMAKKINTFRGMVKTLLQKGYSQSWIVKKLKVKRQRVNYLTLHPLKTEQIKKRKLPEKYI